MTLLDDIDTLAGRLWLLAAALSMNIARLIGSAAVVWLFISRACIARAEARKDAITERRES